MSGKRYGVEQVYDRLRERQEAERRAADNTAEPVDPGRCFITPGVHEYGCPLYKEK